MAARDSEIVSYSAAQVGEVLKDNRALTERILRMRSLAYFAQIRMQLLTETIFEVASGKQELNRLNRNLNSIIAELERQRDVSAKQKQELLDRGFELEAFGYSVSHELKGPIRNVQGMATLLIEEKSDGASESQIEFLASIARNAARMAKLVDDLLNLSRMSRKDMHPTMVDMNRIVENLREEAEAGNPQREIKWEVGDLPQAFGDETALRQVLSNLVGNAVKYTGHEESALIRIYGENAHGEQIYHVADNGAGFDMASAKQLFGVFKRLHSEQEFPGSGLGLAISRRLLEKHGGRIWAQSEPGNGATFSFSLPGRK